MLRKIKNEIGQNKQYIYLSYLIAILTIIPQSIASAPYDLVHLLFLVAVLFITILISKFNKLLFSIFIIYINLTNVVIGHIFIHWGYFNTSIEPRIAVSMVSPMYETLEYLKTYIDYRDALLVVYTIFILGLLYRFLVHYRHSFKIIKFFSFVASTSVIVAFSYYFNPFKNQEPFNIPAEYIELKGYSEFYKTRTDYLSGMKKIYDENSSLVYDKVVVVQGESVNKHHMSIYGYDENTTPFLTHLKSKNSLYVFNVIAPTNQTRYSVPILHTKATVRNFSDPFIHSRSIVGNFNLYGYKSYWISNQGLAGKHDTSIASMVQEADVRYVENLEFSSAKSDETVLSYLNGIKNTPDKEMYLIHLMGSHSDYADRYTDKNVLFKNPTNVIQEYDNSIYYTDYILQNIFTYFKNKFPDKKMLFIYVSDHGEVVDAKLNGHGFLPPFKDEYDVPFAIYSSVKNSRIDEIYRGNKKGYLNLENLNYMIEYISGIGNKSNISYSNHVFALEPENIIDYNKLKFYKP